MPAGPIFCTVDGRNLYGHNRIRRVRSPSVTQVLEQFATEHKLNNLSRFVRPSQAAIALYLTINIAPSTSINKAMVPWCFEQHKTAAFEISVLQLEEQVTSA